MQETASASNYEATPEQGRLGLLARARVLVVDEDADTRRVVERALIRAGYDVLEAASADAALRLVSRMARQGVPIGLVLSNLEVADGRGLEALAGLQRRHSSTPVILMTNFGGPEIYRVAVQLGAAAVLRKPLDLLQLVLAVRVRIRG